MDMFLGMMVPFALLWVGFSLVTGRSLSPQNVLRSQLALLTRLLRWLWKEPPKGGGGSIKHPDTKYYD